MILIKKTTVLTADDDPHLLRLMMRNLQLEGYEVLTASDGKQLSNRLRHILLTWCCLTS